MCLVTVTTFIECQHSKLTYEYCNSCPLQHAPPRTRGVYKGVKYFSVPDIFEYLKDGGKNGSLYNLVNKAKTKMMECPNSPKEFIGEEYKKESVPVHRCVEAEGDGACAGRSNHVKDEYDQFGLLLRRRGRVMGAWDGFSALVKLTCGYKP